MDENQSRQLLATRVWLAGAGIVLLTSALALGAWVFARGNEPFAVDVWWNTVLLGWASPAMTSFSFVMNFLGGGWFGVFIVPLAGALALILVRRRWAAVYFLIALSVSALVVQVLKHLFGRARPEEILVMSDYGSFPSGHVANAATIAVAMLVVFPRVAVFLAGTAWVLLMALSRTYLHAHWLSDTLGGALAGGGAALLTAAFFIRLIAVEQRARAVTAVHAQP